jgi:hypothetical protein
VRAAGQTLADSLVVYVGIGEEFVVAGQSNAANHERGLIMTQGGFSCLVKRSCSGPRHRPSAGCIRPGLPAETLARP